MRVGAHHLQSGQSVEESPGTIGTLSLSPPLSNSHSPSIPRHPEIIAVAGWLFRLTLQSQIKHYVFFYYLFMPPAGSFD